MNRLVREDNQRLNKTTTYKYDKGGNILLEKVYNYTKDNQLADGKVYHFTYASSGWKDQLIDFEGMKITYDSMGRPSSIGNKPVSFNGRGLMTSYGSIAFGYDLDGVRKSISTLSNEKTFLTLGDKVYKVVSKGSQNYELTFDYCMEKLLGFCYNNVRYFYVRNIQGDIQKIYRKDNCQLIAEYVYDAWGNHVVLDANGCQNNDPMFVGNINPFRYRGYYYDVETGLFYCGSRYYNSEICRFISADSLDYLDPKSINGLNLYAYCGDNPVNMVDPSGHFAISTFLISLAIGSLISYGLSEAFGSQIAGGISSTISGGSAIYTGVNLLAFGPIGWIAGGALILVGAGTLAFGVNDIVTGITGTNYIQSWTGMSDGAYTGWEIGLNIASSIGTIAGSLYMNYANVTGNRNPGRTGKAFSRYSTLDEEGVKQYRFFDGNGNAWYDKDFRHTGKMKFPHYHGWNSGIRTSYHWTFWELIEWLL